jgi:hypothetical protein
VELKNLPEFNQDTNLVANKVYSLLNTFNLSTDSFKLLTKFLSSEYGISYNNEKELSFFFQPNKRSDSLAVQKELNNLTAFYNPKTISYLLQDGQVAEQLIPNTDVVGQPFNSNTTKFDLKEINKNIYWSNSTNTPFDFISTSSNPFVSLSLESSTLSDNKFFKYALSEFSPIADEVLFIKSSLFYTYLQDKFDKKDLPSSFTATNYFHDGLQTVTILQW